MIEGLVYKENFISEERAENLVQYIDSQTWSTELSRRVQHYGYKYDYTKRLIDEDSYIGPLPTEFLEIGEYMVSKKLLTDLPDQVIVNEYVPGQGIAMHVDCVPCFSSEIASISLLSSIIMDFKKVKGVEKETLLINPRSLLIFANEARYDWAHGIAKRSTDVLNGEILKRNRRISLTFRKTIY
jgi:alkylated DNA repair dioxygenase AlkB